MHIRIPNLRKLNQGNIGYVHSGCQSPKAKSRQPSDMHVRITNLQKLNYISDDFLGLVFFRLAIRMYISDDCLGLAFRDWQPECAYPMFPGLSFLRLVIRIAYPMVSWLKLFSIGNGLPI